MINFICIHFRVRHDHAFSFADINVESNFNGSLRNFLIDLLWH